MSGSVSSPWKASASPSKKAASAKARREGRRGASTAKSAKAIGTEYSRVRIAWAVRTTPASAIPVRTIASLETVLRRAMA